MTEDILTIIMILNFNIKAKRKNFERFIIYCIFQISNIFLKIFTPFDSKRVAQNKSVNFQSKFLQNFKI